MSGKTILITGEAVLSEPSRLAASSRCPNIAPTARGIATAVPRLASLTIHDIIDEYPADAGAIQPPSAGPAAATAGPPPDFP